MCDPPPEPFPEPRPGARAAASGALVLVVEDDREIAAILRAYLERAGHRAHVATDGEAGLRCARRLRPDLILLDLGLPRRDGFALLSALRVEDQTPVIVVSALDDDLDKLSALRIGADDYVTKPFNPREVMARVAAVLRRARPAPPSVLRLGPIALDAQAHRAWVEGRELDLTPSEFRLLAHLMRHAGRTQGRGALIEAAFEESEALDRTVDSHVSHLRRKLAGAGGMLRTVRGVGYRLDEGP